MTETAMLEVLNIDDDVVAAIRSITKQLFGQDTNPDDEHAISQSEFDEPESSAEKKIKPSSNNQEYVEEITLEGSYSRDLEKYPVMSHSEHTAQKKRIMEEELGMCEALCSTPTGLRLLQLFYERLWNKTKHGTSREYSAASIIISGPDLDYYMKGKDRAAKNPLINKLALKKCKDLGSFCGTFADMLDGYYQRSDKGIAQSRTTINQLRTIKKELALEVLYFRPKFEHWTNIKNDLDIIRKERKPHEEKNSVRSTQVFENFYKLFDKKFENTKMLLDSFVEGNLRLVKSTSTKYKVSRNLLSDLVSAGNAYMRRAVEKWSPENTGSFATYAIHWIRLGMSQEVKKASTITHRSNHAYAFCGKVCKQIKQHMKDSHRYPTTIEIADALEVPESKVISAISSLAGELSLDGQLNGGDDGYSFYDILTSNQRSIEKDVSTRFSVAYALSNLTPKEQNILCRRFAIGTDTGGIPFKKHTLDEIGNLYGVSRERIRQIEVNALMKCRMRLTAKPDPV